MNTIPRLRVAQFPSVTTQLCQCREIYHGRRRKKLDTIHPWPEGHGENIWVFAHRRSHQIVYSLQAQMNAFHALKQMPFNGKKTKPAKLRKDYWFPMAKIELPAGAGSVGRNIFQKLRELKHLHEVSWSDDMLYKHPSEYTFEEKQRAAAAAADDKRKNKHGGGKTFKLMRTVAERGFALNNQKANAIADMAAVLAGQGRGNRLLITPATTTTGKDGRRRHVHGNELDTTTTTTTATTITTGKADDDNVTPLMGVTIRWSNSLDTGYAESWSDNVLHVPMEESVGAKNNKKPITPKSKPISPLVAA